MTLAEELKSRGLIEHESAPAETILATPRTVYLGIDPTADSAHVGHLVPFLLMKRLGAAGHKLIFLVGGGTGMIGDPKEKGERVLIDEKTLRANTKALQKQIKALLGRTSFRMVDNAEWLFKTQMIYFLREIGKHFTVNDLIKRDLIKKRLDDPNESISYTEFTYSLLQALDYLVLHRKYSCDLQIGASDQWTNILSGVDLIRKKNGNEVYALTVPLITDSTGRKFGKSEGNAIWLDPKKTSPFQFYQFWINLPDDNVEQYLKVYTFMSVDAINELMAKHRENPGMREAQETLASQVTTLVHGPAAAAEAAAATDALFGGRPFHELSRMERAVALAEAPSFALTKSQLAQGFPLVDALAAGGLVSSKSEARRLIEQKGITLSGFPVPNPDQKIFTHDLPDGVALVRKGKREVLVLVLK
ncbi:MAG TPA: tyrosine--tRNA ligase [Candidatus Paceibacterota bacterium]|nr:tyrosine--tRNA ligase [Candidatus Paceibacterota bacterium]